MKVFFMGIVIHVMDMVTKIFNVDLMKGDIMEDSITLQGVGDVIKQDTLMFISIARDATILVDLATNPRIVGTQEEIP